MRRNIIFVITFVLLVMLVSGTLMFCGGQTNTSMAKDLPPDFRKVNWDMNKSDVKSIENSANLSNETDSELTYSISQFSCETTVKYFFRQNILEGCVIDFGPPIANNDRYQKVYSNVFGLMLKKYGDFEKTDMKQIPGGMEMYTLWSTGRSKIKLSSFIKNGASAIIIKYIKNLPAATGSDVNGMKWGASIEEVKAKENKRLTMVKDVSFNMNGDKVIKYNETLAGVPTSLAYVFNNDRLTQAIYIINNKHTDKRKYAEEFIKLNDWLMKKHNYPDKSTQLAAGFKRYTGSKQDWPKDFASGQLTTLSSEWNIQHTKVHVRLAAMGKVIMFTMGYETKLKFKSKVKKQLPPEADNI
jgi:hypothetical protein